MLKRNGKDIAVNVNHLAAFWPAKSLQEGAESTMIRLHFDSSAFEVDESFLEVVDKVRLFNK